MHQHHEVRITACPDYVWAILTDVEHWPEWAPELREVVPYDGGPLVVGGRVRMRTRQLPPREWRVREVRAHRGFTWEDAGVGSAATLAVGIAPAPPGGTTVSLTLDRSGWVGSLVGRMTGAAALAHLEDLAGGLRRRCEAGQCGPAARSAARPAATPARGLG